MKVIDPWIFLVKKTLIVNLFDNINTHERFGLIPNKKLSQRFPNFFFTAPYENLTILAAP